MTQTDGSAASDPRLGHLPPEYASLDGAPGSPGADALPTLDAYGKRLTLGYRDAGGEMHRDFELVEWDWDLEEELGELVEREKTITMGVYISEIVGRATARLGKIDLTKLKRSQRRLIVSNMFMADVLQIYVWIRIGALGHRLRLEPFVCENCPQRIDFVGDLRTLEVQPPPEEGKVPTREVKLPRPFSYGGADRDRVTVGPLRWAFMETGDASTLTNPAKLRKATIAHGIVSVPGAPEGPVALQRDHLRQLGSAGVNAIVAAIDEVGGGVVMEMAGTCPRCGHPYRKPIDWSYADFFGRSSR